MRHTVALALAVLVLFAGCLNGGIVEPTGETGTEEGDTLPSFTLPAFEGGSFDSAELEGEVYVLQGFASWCPTCKIDANEIGQAKQAFPELRVVHVDIWPNETIEDVRGFRKESDITELVDERWVWLKGDAQWQQQFDIVTMDVTYVVNREGVIIYKDLGVTRFDRDLKPVLKQVF